MKITADANVLVRVVVRDDLDQARAALALLEQARAVYVPLPSLCELAWVLGRTYRFSRPLIASSIKAIIERGNVLVDLGPIRAGLRLLEAGGDFADGAIAASGLEMGSETFVSFDRKAVAGLQAAGIPAQLASSYQ